MTIMSFIIIKFSLDINVTLKWMMLLICSAIFSSTLYFLDHMQTSVTSVAWASKASMIAFIWNCPPLWMPAYFKCGCYIYKKSSLRCLKKDFNHVFQRVYRHCLQLSNTNSIYCLCCNLSMTRNRSAFYF